MIDELTKLEYMLGVMKKQRDVLYQDCINADYTLMHGLREERQTAYELYSERYRLTWIDAHWNEVYQFAQRNLNTEKDREALYLYFAKWFREFIDPMGFRDENLSEFFFTLLKKEIVSIDDLLSIHYKNKDAMNQFMNLQEIHEKNFDERLKSLIAERKENRYGKNG